MPFHNLVLYESFRPREEGRHLPAAPGRNLIDTMVPETSSHHQYSTSPESLPSPISPLTPTAETPAFFDMAERKTPPRASKQPRTRRESVPRKASHSVPKKPGQTSSRVPKPKNSFMCFRSWYYADRMNDAKINQRTVSKIVGVAWKALTSAERAPFEAQAEREKMERELNHPEAQPKATRKVQERVVACDMNALASPAVSSVTEIDSVGASGSPHLSSSESEHVGVQDFGLGRGEVLRRAHPDTLDIDHQDLYHPSTLNFEEDELFYRTSQPWETSPELYYGDLSLELMHVDGTEDSFLTFPFPDATMVQRDDFGLDISPSTSYHFTTDFSSLSRTCSGSEGTLFAKREYELPGGLNLGDLIVDEYLR